VGSTAVSAAWLTCCVQSTQLSSASDSASFSPTILCAL